MDFFAVYLLLDVRKKVKLLAVNNGIKVAFKCTNCKNPTEYSYTEYMQIVKKPLNKIQNFSKTRNKYLFNCATCDTKKFQELLYEIIPENSNFKNQRRKIILWFLLKEYALGILIAGILSIYDFLSE